MSKVRIVRINIDQKTINMINRRGGSANPAWILAVNRSIIKQKYHYIKVNSELAEFLVRIFEKIWASAGQGQRAGFTRRTLRRVTGTLLTAGLVERPNYITDTHIARTDLLPKGPWVVKEIEESAYESEGVDAYGAGQRLSTPCRTVEINLMRKIIEMIDRHGGKNNPEWTEAVYRSFMKQAYYHIRVNQALAQFLVGVFEKIWVATGQGREGGFTRRTIRRVTDRFVSAGMVETPPYMGQATSAGILVPTERPDIVRTTEAGEDDATRNKVDGAGTRASAGSTTVEVNLLEKTVDMINRNGGASNPAWTEAVSQAVVREPYLHIRVNKALAESLIVIFEGLWNRVERDPERGRIRRTLRRVTNAFVAAGLVETPRYMPKKRGVVEQVEGDDQGRRRRQADIPRSSAKFDMLAHLRSSLDAAHARIRALECLAGRLALENDQLKGAP